MMLELNDRQSTKAPSRSQILLLERERHELASEIRAAVAKLNDLDARISAA